MNYWSVAAAKDTIPCTKEEYEAIGATLIDDDNCSGFKAKFELNAKGGELYVYAEECAADTELPEKFLELYAGLLKKAGRKSMDFGVACYPDRVSSAPNSCGGYHFRIYDDGSTECKISYWPSEIKAMLRKARMVQNDH